MSVFLITRPEHDDTTHYLSAWSKEAIETAQDRGMKAIDLNRERANKSEVESVISKVSPNFIVFNGHGSDNTVTGHNNQPIITAGENEDLLKSKTVYAISCKSAKILGPKSIDAGAISYTGYDDDFIFLYEPEKISRSLQDGTAKLFFEPSKLFMTSLIKGSSVSESRKKSESLIRSTIVKMLGSNSDANIVKFLWWDLKHFVSHGNLEATI